MRQSGLLKSKSPEIDFPGESHKIRQVLGVKMISQPDAGRGRTCSIFARTTATPQWHLRGKSPTTVECTNFVLYGDDN